METTIDTPTEGRLKEELASLDVKNVLTLDEKFNVILIVGGLDQSGQIRKAFKVNRNALRMASKPFEVLLTGPFAETEKAIIQLPVDPSDTFEILLTIVHYKYDQLPRELSTAQLLRLAVLCDKYDCSGMVTPLAILRQWLEPSRRNANLHKSKLLPDWLQISDIFKLKEHRENLLSALVLDIALSPTDQGLIRIIDGKHVEFGDTYPEALLDIIRSRRSQIIREVHGICNKALDANLCALECAHGSRACMAVRAGILIKAFQPLKMFPKTTNYSQHQMSVREYLVGIRSIHSVFCHQILFPFRCDGKSVSAECKRSISIEQSVLKAIKKHTSETAWKLLETSSPGRLLHDQRGA